MATIKFAKVIRDAGSVWGERLCDVIEKALCVQIGKLLLFKFLKPPILSYKMKLIKLCSWVVVRIRHNI